MRSFIALCAVTASLVSLRAEASPESCAQALLQGSLYGELQVSAAQAQQLQWIRNDTSQRRAVLQARLEAVQAQLDQLGIQGDYAGQGPVLQSQQSSLLQRLASVDATALARAEGLLTLWQREQCSDPQPMVAAPPVVVVPAPVPVYRRVIVPRPVIRRVHYPVPAPIHYPRVIHHPRVIHPAAVPAPRPTVVFPGHPVPRGPVAVHVPAPRPRRYH